MSRGIHHHLVIATAIAGAGGALISHLAHQARLDGAIRAAEVRGEKNGIAAGKLMSPQVETDTVYAAGYIDGHAAALRGEALPDELTQRMAS